MEEVPVSARRLGLPVMLMTGEGDHRLAALADVALAVPHAAAARVALHGDTLAASVLGPIAAAGEGAMATLDRPGALRAEFDLPRRGRTEGSHSD